MKVTVASARSNHPLFLATVYTIELVQGITGNHHQVSTAGAQVCVQSGLSLVWNGPLPSSLLLPLSHSLSLTCRSYPSNCRMFNHLWSSHGFILRGWISWHRKSPHQEVPSVQGICRCIPIVPLVLDPSSHCLCKSLLVVFICNHIFAFCSTWPVGFLLQQLPPSSLPVWRKIYWLPLGLFS